MAGSPDWDDIRFFLAAARSASLAEAARMLRVSAPTVGRRVRNLEQRLDLHLFIYGGGELRLTSAGRAILGVAEEMERKSFDLGHAVTRQAFVQEPPVRITCIGSVAMFIVRHFEELYALTGQTDVEINSTGQRLSLARNEADIALRMGRIPKRGNLYSRRIGRIVYATYASAEFLRRHQIETPEAALRSLFVGFLKNPQRRSQSSWLYEFGRQGRFRLRVNELHMRFEGARGGLGITLLPCHLGDSEQELVRVAPPPRELIEDIYLLMHALGRDVPRIKRVGEGLVKLFAAHADELTGRQAAARRRDWSL
jgi:DNA-binding transcriptional LysR family regulator